MYLAAPWLARLAFGLDGGGFKQMLLAAAEVLNGFLDVGLSFLLFCYSTKVLIGWYIDESRD